jgi:predicted NodU family carbamoyl transferase
MKILACKPGHDGHIAYVKDGNLKFSLEAEKDSWPRYAEISPSMFLRSLNYIDDTPDVVAVSGWVKGRHSRSAPIGAGYWGTDERCIVDSNQIIFGRKARFFSSSHERSHILCAYGLSPFPQGQPCYVLIWEGSIGAFYHVDSEVRVTKIADVFEGPGYKYNFLYGLADPSFSTGIRREDAGKLMALSSFGESGQSSADERKLIDFLLSQDYLDKRDFEWSPYVNIGVESREFKNLARKFTDSMFDKFYNFARDNLMDHLPLLIAGGCGLNCDWNSRWKHGNLFSDVFVPPCANDCGSAVGTAVDALRHYTGRAKITWDVYSGEEFEFDEADLSAFDVSALDLQQVADLLKGGHVLAWVQGRCEIGPRALGNRSILAAPFTFDMQARLNEIKQREGFRPVAPICMEDEIAKFFEPCEPSPYMLYFQKTITGKLPAVTHVDGSTRVQSVTRQQNSIMYDLLLEFRKITGYGVLCNTSLNLKGRGFINRMSDLVLFAKERQLDGFVVHRELYELKRSVRNPDAPSENRAYLGYEI